jgi:hypothetical protein
MGITRIAARKLYKKALTKVPELKTLRRLAPRVGRFAVDRRGQPLVTDHREHRPDDEPENGNDENAN